MMGVDPPGAGADKNTLALWSRGSKTKACEGPANAVVFLEHLTMCCTILKEVKWASEDADLVFAVHSPSATHLRSHMGPGRALTRGCYPAEGKIGSPWHRFPALFLRRDPFLVSPCAVCPRSLK